MTVRAGMVVWVSSGKGTRRYIDPLVKIIKRNRTGRPCTARPILDNGVLGEVQTLDNKMLKKLRRIYS